MARVRNQISPEVAKQLVDLAVEMQRSVFWDEGIPEWGTKARKIKSESLGVGPELSRLMMPQAVAGQVAR